MDEKTSREFAVVTGASSGIGRELARIFASEGYDLLITSEDDTIGAVAEAIAAETRAQVDSLQVDLASDDGVDLLYARITADPRPLDAIALNAGVGAGGAFVAGSHPSGHDTDLVDELRIIDLNIRSTIHLAKHVLADMVRRNSGKVLVTSSIASTMPGSYQAVYNGSKSFIQSWVLALRDELRETDVTITSLMPGATETDFFRRAGMLDAKVGAGDKDDPIEVARMGFEAMEAGKERAVAESIGTRLQAELSRVLPDRVKAAMHRNLAEPGSGDGPHHG
jgi:short-subunit dehydrogenase